MFRVLDSDPLPHPSRSRRELLRAGAIGLGGLTLSGMLRAEAARSGGERGSFGRARSCILLYMVGGPPQLETWDPKPQVSAEIRGAYGAIGTPVDGLQVGELMPRLARLAPHYAVLRSVATDVHAHTGSGYWMLTGHPHPNRSGESIPPAPSDWPTLGAVVKRLLPGGRDLPPVVALPEPVKNNPGIVVAGQGAGFLPPEDEPFLLACDPSAARFQVSGLSPLAELPPLRLSRRRRLLTQVDATLHAAQDGAVFARADGITRQAFDLLTGERARRAFALDEEPAALRERYGRHKWGQSCLLARRLVEAGVRLVQVNWPREPGDLSIGNPCWDTHSDHERRLKEHLMPPMDQGCAALLEDLRERGLLEETLVVWMGEFGRSPRFNPQGGRDHWGSVFSMMLAGGGIRGGTVYGESDRIGAFPVTDRVGPEAIHATIHHCLGIPAAAQIADPFGRPLPACEGEPIRAVLAER